MVLSAAGLAVDVGALGAVVAALPATGLLLGVAALLAAGLLLGIAALLAAASIGAALALAIAALMRFAWVSCTPYQMAIAAHAAATAPNEV
jgi:predicted lipid-binding transport protein (Tim44 family)